MPNVRTHGSYRTGGLWAGAGISFGALVVGCGVALLDMLEFDERCNHGLIRGPGRLLRVREQAFPPATVCEFERGDVSSVGGTGVLGALLWLGMVALVVCLVVALVAEWFEPRLGSDLVVPTTRGRKLRRTGTAFFVTGSVFLMLYALAGWKLFTGPASVCSAGADWGADAPRTLAYSFFPPQATCQYTSGLTRRMNPEWVASLLMESAVPALLAGVGCALAWLRLRAERREAPPGTAAADSALADPGRSAR
ncbi:hypothetical protein AB0N87_08790 [Streptomyces sp. NPDC093228]|uniref:hypothetical protein n=1 Tax=unclassified Streptomyces TaxID=2593676 RepID=UPI0007411D9D|nr:MULTISPECIES: hypothetical protein [unclassified Streptomyces]KUJ49783.1 hypothetical protein ADL25_09925 [Streptomyces sp. NRRL F-5122]MDX3265888.1 hypothetical protein [Streptomyces sp. MI02-2A]REE61976.1 hypothetical protein BX257_4580 [Streptomyces sp. 3212.3]